MSQNYIVQSNLHLMLFGVIAFAMYYVQNCRNQKSFKKSLFFQYLEWNNFFWNTFIQRLLINTVKY